MPIPAELLRPDNLNRKPGRADELMAQHKALVAMNVGQDPVFTYQQARGNGLEAELETIKHDAVAEEMLAIREALRHTIETQPEIAVEMAEDAQEAMRIVEEEAENPTYAFEVLLNYIANENPEWQEEDASYHAEQLWYAYAMQASFDNTFGSVVQDVLGYLFKPNLALITKDMTDGRWWTAASDLNKFRTRFFGLPLEQRQAVFMDMINNVKERTPNQLKAMEFLSSVVDADMADKAELHLFLDKVGAVALPVDLVGAGAFLASKAAKASRILALTRNVEKELEALELAAKYPDVSQAMNISQLEANAALSPVRIPDSFISGMSDEARRQYAQNVASLNKSVQHTEETVLPEGILSLSPNQDRAAARATREILSDEAGLAVTNVRVNPSDDARNMFITYDVTDDTGTYTRTLTKPYTTSDIDTGFNTAGHGAAQSYTITRAIASPNIKFQDDRESLVSAMQRGMYQAGKWRKMFAREFGQIFTSAKHVERKKVAEALSRGNLDGVVYSPDQLAGNFGLTSDAGVAQYYSFRSMLDRMHDLKNREVALTHRAAGHKLFQMQDGDAVVKQYGTARSAQDAILQTNAQTALFYSDDAVMPQSFALRTGEGGAVSPKLKELLDEGFVLLRPQEHGGTVKVNDNFYQFVLARRSQVKNIEEDTKLINYVPGYLPILYGPDANYFGMVSKYGVVDGKHTEIGRGAKVYFPNRTDAETWVRANNLRHLQEKYKGDEARALTALDDPNETLPYTFKTDRELDQIEFDTMQFGGPITGHRAEDRLVRGLNAESAQYLDPFYSISKYMDNISNNMPLAAFRVGLEEKWMNHARQYGAIEHGFNGGFQAAIHRVRASVGIDADIRNKLIDAHQHINFNNRVPTLGEREVAGRLTKTAERLEDIIGKDSAIPRYMQSMDHANMPDLIRAATFHQLLGVYNPAQVVVQGFGATISMSIDPVNTVRAIPTLVAITKADHIVDPIQKAAYLKKAEGVVPGITERYRAWERTGLFDEIVAASADYKSAISSHPVGVDLWGRVGRVASRELERGTVAYKMGELFNRRMSFSVASERHLRKGGGWSNSEIKQVMTETTGFMLNMDRANKAQFQKGWWSIPTQFMQVHTKYVEAMLGKQFTKREKAKLMGNQLALFGAMGVPFGTGLLSYFADKGALDPIADEHGDLSARQLQGLREGIMGYVLGEMLEIDASIAPRGAIPIGLSEGIERFFADDAALWEVFAGASGTLLDRSVEIGHTMHQVFNYTSVDPSAIDTHDAIAVGHAVAGFISTSRSMMGAWELAHNPYLYNRRGDKVLDTEQLNTRTKIARALGFQPTLVSDTYELMNNERAVNQRINEKADAFAEYFHKRHMAGAVGEKEGRRLELAIQSIVQSEGPEIATRIRDRFFERVMNGDTIMDRAIKDVFDREFNNIYHEWDRINRLSADRREGN